MDIRKFLNKARNPVLESSSTSSTDNIHASSDDCMQNTEKRIKLNDKTSSDNDNPVSNKLPDSIASTSSDSHSQITHPAQLSNRSSESIVETEKYDLGLFISTVNISDKTKYNLLVNPLTPLPNYNFKTDVAEGKRAFRVEWMQKYNWMVYSKTLKGALCKYCVVFKPAVHRGFQGAFIKKEFTKYKDLNECAKSHEKSDWHKNSVVQASDFIKIMSGKASTVIERLNTQDRELVENNRKKLVPIISSILFCGMHDIALRGKESHEGNFEDLIKFRVESGDKILEEHLSSCNKNAKYTSHMCQNEIIGICGEVLRDMIVSEVNDCNAFSLLADETADIAGVEQLSIGVRYVDKNNVVKEEFLGFTELKSMSAQSISDAILKYARECGLNLEKLVGLGFDGCSTMAGKENGVQKLIRNVYPKATFFHCSSHRLNLVVNDPNSVPQIQNSIGVIKEVINFFRESPKRRSLVTNIPLLSETRWSAKYKSIRIFQENFVSIKETLQNISTDRNFNSQTRQKANQLFNSTSEPVFLVCLRIISKYSSQLEPVTNALQGVSTNLLSVKKHVDVLVQIFQKERENPDPVFSEIFKKCKEYENMFDMEFKIPRITQRQTMRSNIPADSPETYFRISIFIPYLDSLISSLTTRFSEDTTIAFSLVNLHPSNVLNINEEIIRNIAEHYNFENFEAECFTWKEMWKNKTASDDIGFSTLLNEECQFFPKIANAIKIFLSLPPTTCSIERSFSTLRRVKTWLRSTMAENRLAGLCLISVHRDKIEKNKSQFIGRVLDQFGQDRRRLKFVFS